MHLPRAERVASRSSGIAIWLQKTLRPGDVFIDIGANVGTCTQIGADLVGRSGRVFAFEPGHETFDRLRERFGRQEHVTVINAGVEERSGSAPLYLDSGGGGRHSLDPRNICRWGGTLNVPVISLDDFRCWLSRVDVIKLDARGAEGRIFQGARALLSAFHPKIVFELWPYGLMNLGTDARAVLSDLRAADFSLFRLSAAGTLTRERQTDDFLPGARRSQSIDVVAWPLERAVNAARSEGRGMPAGAGASAQRDNTSCTGPRDDSAGRGRVLRGADRR